MSSSKQFDSPALDETSTALFRSLCQFIWTQGDPLPLIYEIGHEIYTKHGITQPALSHLEAIGLVSVEAAGFVKKRFGRHTRLFYGNRLTKIQFPQETANQLDLGHVLLTDEGKALAKIYSAPCNQEFYEYVIKSWSSLGMMTSSILTNR